MRNQHPIPSRLVAFVSTMMTCFRIRYRFLAPIFLVGLLTITGCAGVTGGPIDYDRKNQLFDFPPHDPRDADRTSRHFLIKNGERITVSRDYPHLPITDQTIIVEVWVYRYDTDGDGQYDLWRKEFDFPEVTIDHPDGRRLINPPHREIRLYIGVRPEKDGARFTFHRVLIDRYDADRRLGADGIFEEQLARPDADLRPDDIETAL